MEMEITTGPKTPSYLPDASGSQWGRMGGRSSGFLIWMGRTARNQLHGGRPTSTHVHIPSCTTWSSYQGLRKFVGQEADFL